MKLKLLTLFLTLFASITLMAQSIKGIITDAQTGDPLSYATFSLYHQADSTLADGTISDDTGLFELKAKPGKYYAKVDFLSYQSLTLNDLEVKKGIPLDLGKVELSTASATLNEVVVQAEKSTMQMALDKRIFNVGKDLGNSGNTAADILDKEIWRTH